MDTKLEYINDLIDILIECKNNKVPDKLKNISILYHKDSEILRIDEQPIRLGRFTDNDNTVHIFSSNEGFCGTFEFGFDIIFIDLNDQEYDINSIDDFFNISLIENIIITYDFILEVQKIFESKNLKNNIMLYYTINEELNYGY